MIRATKSSVLALLVALSSGVGAFALPTDARACGGVFVSQPVIETPTSGSIVRDHRMAIAIGRTKTVIWDEVRLAGDPRDFVWITPVKPGTKIELADDEWMSALDVSTQPAVYGPRDGSVGGCALTGCSADDESSVSGGGVYVVKEEVLGPYDSVTVRSAGDPDAPYRWLVENGYRIDDQKVRAVLASYAQAGFDFAALKLHATCTQTAMQPVRIVIPGTDPHILIRMALAGAGIEVVPITLFVLAEAPYRPQNYPFGFLDDDALEWDRKSRSTPTTYAPRSNYDELANDVMSREGRTWLVESAQIAELAGGGTAKLPTPGLYEAYEALCAGSTPRNAGTTSTSTSGSAANTNNGTRTPCLADAGVGPASDAGDAGDAGDASDANDASDGGGDASDDAGDADVDASNDAGEEDDANNNPSPPPSYDAGVVEARCSRTGSDSDYALATRDVVGTPNIWVTRLRARIQPNALADDLTLTPAVAPDDKAISSLHQVARYDDEDDRPSKRSCATTKVVRHEKRAPAGTWALGAAAALVLASWLRRTKRR